MTNCTFDDAISDDYRAAAQQGRAPNSYISNDAFLNERASVMKELAAESQKLGLYDIVVKSGLTANAAPQQQVWNPDSQRYEIKPIPAAPAFSELTLRLNDLKGSIHLSRTGDQKLIEELHRLAAENRELKNQLALRTEPTNRTRLSTSWEHLPDVIPTNAVTSRSVPDFLFAALRRGNKQVVGLMTERPA